MTLATITRAAGVLMLAAAPVGIRASPDDTERFYSPAYRNCTASGDAAQGVTAAMMSCTSAEIERQEAQLNAAYRSRIGSLTAVEATRLRVDERSWIKRRDATCRRAASADAGGSLAGIDYSSCILDETIRRTQLLRGQGPARPTTGAGR